MDGFGRGHDARGPVGHCHSEPALSAIGALEIGILVRRNRMVISDPGAAWFDTLAHRLNARLPALPPAPLFVSTQRGSEAPTDPFDSIMIATARANGLTLLTRDSAILACCNVHAQAHMRC